METTRVVLAELQASLKAQYSAQLQGFGRMMKPKVRDSLEAGFADGVQAGVHHVIKMLGVTVKE